MKPASQFVALERRHRLLEAALRLFARGGYHGVSVPEIAKAAGVATGSVYRHFESKSHLANVLLREHYSALHLVLLRASGAGGVHALFGATMEFAETQPSAFDYLFLLGHDEYADGETRTLRAQIDVTVRGGIEAQWIAASAGDEGRSDGAVAQPGASVVATEVYWAVCAFVVRALRHGVFSGELDVCALAERFLQDGLSRPPRRA